MADGVFTLYLAQRRHSVQVGGLRDRKWLLFRPEYKIANPKIPK